MRGDTAAEAKSFNDVVEKHVRAHPGIKHLVIYDENLTYDEARLSGSLLGEALIKHLSGHGLLADVLVMVRSANDSGEDQRLFTTRVHGFLPKRLVARHTDLLALIAEPWIQRFGCSWEGESKDALKATETFSSAHGAKLISAHKAQLDKHLVNLHDSCLPHAYANVPRRITFFYNFSHLKSY